MDGAGTLLRRRWRTLRGTDDGAEDGSVHRGFVAAAMGRNVLSASIAMDKKHGDSQIHPLQLHVIHPGARVSLTQVARQSRVAPVGTAYR